MKRTLYYLICLYVLVGFFSCQNNNDCENIRNEKSKVIPVKVDSNASLALEEKRKPFIIPNSEVISLTSSINSKEYDVYIKLPRSYKKTNKNYPVLVLTDAGYAFPLVSSIYKRLIWTNKIEEIIIVGISYAKGEHFGISRTRDFTPTYSPDEPNGYSKEARLVSGQADKFIDFINLELFTFLQNNYRIDMTSKIFAGHSLGGLLANYMVVSRPETFDFYLSGSPSLWYHNKSIFKIEQSYSEKHTDLETHLFMCIGGKEDTQGKFKMVRDMFELHNKLLSRNYRGLTIKSISIPEEDHETVYPSFITRGLLWIFNHKNNADTK